MSFFFLVHEMNIDATVRTRHKDAIHVLSIPGYEALPEVKLKDFWLDRYEITQSPIQGLRGIFHDERA
jgi:hypothetical protein